MKKLTYWILFLLLTGISCSLPGEQKVKDVMDRVVTQLYKSPTPEDLTSLTRDNVLKLFSDQDLQILATTHWSFDVNVPVTVSVMRSAKQKDVPFWLQRNGFVKTNLHMKNEQTEYEVWQKSFDAGHVGLGVNSFDQGLGMHYFVAVAPKNKADSLVLNNFFPQNQFVGVLENGAFTYHDWDELVLTDVPEQMKGEKLLTTVRGRTSESHLIGAFRTTASPSSSKPDQIHLSWSSDPATTMDIQWRTDTTVNSGEVKFRRKGSAEEQVVSAEKVRQEDRMLANDRYVNFFTVKLRNLKPGSIYEYAVGKDNNWDSSSNFTTAAANDSFSFLWFGDTHFSPKFGQLLQSAYREHSDAAFYSIVGDLVSDGLFRNQWDDLLDYSKGVINNIPLMAVPGNHDNRAGLGAQLYRNQFSYPLNGPKGVPTEQTYAFTYKNALFLMIDATSPIDSQSMWIEQQLKDTKATWKIAMFHFPPYNWEEPYFNIQKAWVPLFDRYHADMVLGGHIHYYMRSKPMKDGKVVKSYNDGTAYIISVGIPTGPHERTEEPYAQVRNGEGHLYQYIKIEGNKLLFKAVNGQGKIIDSFEIWKQNPELF